MSSKSLTAVTSFVSVIREKTVFVLRLNIKGCQRVAVPIAIIVSCLLAVGLLIAAGATDQMVKERKIVCPLTNFLGWGSGGITVELRDKGTLSLTLNGTGENKGDLHFGLFRGAHNVSQRISSADDEPDTSDYLIYNVYESEDIIGVYTTTVTVGLTILLCVITAGLAFFNTFGVYTSWIYGPPMLYALALISAFMAALSLGVLSDYYLWELDEKAVGILKDSLPSNLEYLADIYTSQSSLQYSFWLLFGGSLIPLFSFLLSWRLLVLLPSKTSTSGLEKSASAFEMSEQSQANFDATAAPAHVFY